LVIAAVVIDLIAVIALLIALRPGRQIDSPHAITTARRSA
jgi:hypothetical protein